jgi:hypothetical protein
MLVQNWVCRFVEHRSKEVVVWLEGAWNALKLLNPNIQNCSLQSFKIAIKESNLLVFWKCLAFWPDSSEFVPTTLSPNL